MNEEILKHMATQVDDLHTHIVGKPGATDKGLLVRVDRLEQTSKKASWFAGVGFAAAIGAFITTAWSKIIHS